MLTNPMKPPLHALTLAVLTLAWASPLALEAGTFKRITIDGQFTDWAGVPVAFADEADAPDAFDYKDVYIANDDQFLYVRATLHAPAPYPDFHHQVLLDADNNAGTGHPWGGLGSEFFIEDGGGYQQKNGGFNEGVGAGLEWAVAPAGEVTQFEARISRNVQDAEGLPVFVQDLITLSLQVLDSSWATQDAAAAIPYEFAPTPPPATGTQTLLGLTTAPWYYDDSGIDQGTDWRTFEFDHVGWGWMSGLGLLGFGAPAGVYPNPVQTALATGQTTYYLRAPFEWNADVTGLALVASAYLSDGAAFYLNGALVKSLRLPAGDPNYQAPATGGPATPGQAEVFSLPVSALVVGQNVLAVEVHQSTATPTDLVFGLSLTATDSQPPAIEDPTQPADRTVVEGESTTFSVGNIIGSPPFTFQWYKDGEAIPGATAATYQIPVVLVTDAGGYSLEIANSQGQTVVSRSAVLTTTGVPVAFSDPALPADVTAAQGQAIALTVAVTGSPLLSYQWYKDGALLEGATGAQLTFANLTLADAGRYAVTVANRLNSVTSREAVVTVTLDTTPPTVTGLEGSARQIIITFSEPLDPATAAGATHYTVNGGITVLSAAPDPADPSVVRLTTSAQTFGAAYVLTLSGVTDRFGNAVQTAVPFRSAIVIDGDFEDWTGIPVADSQPQLTAEGLEFKDLYLAHDDRFLYLRFSFHAPVGPFPVNHFYHFNLDTDADPATGRSVAGIGAEVMIENGGGYQQKNGGFNEGTVSGLDLLLAPANTSTEFEARLSRQATYDTDGLPVFGGDNIAVEFELINSAWSLLHLAPPTGGVPYTFTELPPLSPGPLRVSLAGGQVEITWSGGGVLEARDSLNAGTWAPVANAASPYRTAPSGAQRYFRLRQ